MMGANYGRRKDDNGFKIDMFPKWLNVVMIILKGSLVLIPFIISSIAMFYESDMGIMESGLWNCIWIIILILLLI